MSQVDDSQISSDGVDMDQPQYSSFSVDSQGAVHLDHEIRKWIKQDGASPHVRPVAPYALVTFHARIAAQVYDARAVNTTGVSSRAQTLVDTFCGPGGEQQGASPAGAGASASTTAASTTSVPRGEPIDAIVGVTKLFRGLEIALRSMSVGEQADFVVPPEMGHYFGVAPNVPARCMLDLDIKLMSCENFRAISKLPTVDYEPFKVTCASWALSSPSKSCRSRCA